MSTDKYPFKLQEGDITGFEGDAMVIPCWQTLHTGNVIASALERRLDELGVDLVDFWPRYSEERVPLFSAHYYERPQMPKTKSIILAACYTGHEPSISFRERALKTTRNVMEVAGQHDVRSIGFPAYMTGGQHGMVVEVVAAMADVFREHIKTGGNPRDISLYVFGEASYRAASVLLDRKFK